jgi:zinc transport system substrate-binding protein
MKKIAKILLSAAFCICIAFPMTGCAEKDGRISIVCSLYPQYDWVRQIIGEQSGKFRITYLLKGGKDLHSYQLTPRDRIEIEDSDLFIYGGGESEAAASIIVSAAENGSVNTVSMLGLVDAKEEETVPGMQDEEGEEDGGSGHGEKELDEHVWLSLRNAEIIVGEIAERICALDSENAEYYRRNAAGYINELAALDELYISAVEAAKRNVILVADRFPFRYLADDYGLTYHAAFSGCSADVEADPKTVNFLIDRLNGSNLPVIFILENSSNRPLAETVKRNSDAKNQAILTLNACQSISKRDIAGGISYLSIMTENLKVLKLALD